MCSARRATRYRYVDWVKPKAKGTIPQPVSEALASRGSKVPNARPTQLEGRANIFTDAKGHTETNRSLRNVVVNP